MSTYMYGKNIETSVGMMNTKFKKELITSGGWGGAVRSPESFTCVFNVSPLRQFGGYVEVLFSAFFGSLKYFIEEKNN